MCIAMAAGRSGRLSHLPARIVLALLSGRSNRSLAVQGERESRQMHCGTNGYAGCVLIVRIQRPIVPRRTTSLALQSQGNTRRMGIFYAKSQKWNSREQLKKIAIGRASLLLRHPTIRRAAAISPTARHRSAEAPWACVKRHFSQVPLAGCRRQPQLLVPHPATNQQRHSPERRIPAPQ